MDATREEDIEGGNGVSALHVLRLLREVPVTEKERHDGLVQISLKPPTTRRSTAPGYSTAAGTNWQAPAFVQRIRDTSPLLSTHLGSSPSIDHPAPAMSRTRSMPSVHTSTHPLCTLDQRPSSPAGSPHRHRVVRRPVDDAFPGSRIQPVPRFDVGTIPEGEELPGLPSDVRSTSPTHGLSAGSAVSRHHRSSSPLRWNAVSGGFGSSSPGLFMPYPTSQHMRFNELSFASSGSTYASSSMPSTPTSIRSRSPSISSLETIPDTPDAEEAALEVEKMAQLKAAVAADDKEVAHGEARKINAPDNGCSRGRSQAYNARDKRKRWSICGGERRGDLDLETIPED